MPPGLKKPQLSHCCDMLAPRHQSNQNQRMEIQLYSRRLLSPFHGVQQVLSVPGGVAESMDGRDWKLYVADERIISHTGLSEVRYGDWNAKQGRLRSRVRGTAASDLIETIGDRLIWALERTASMAPFPPADRFECWLLQAESGLPLALLDSSLESDLPASTAAPVWYPGGLAGRGFSSTAGSITDLASLIREAAGKQPTALWIERLSNQTGRGLNGALFDAEDFPPLLLTTQWAEKEQQQLVTDYLDWQAPWLLQLELDIILRRQLEQAAWRRPRETARVYRLFPEVCDTGGLTVARVKARMMQDEPRDTRLPEPFYPFYNE